MLTACTGATATADSASPVDDSTAPTAFNVEVEPPTVPDASPPTTAPPTTVIPEPVIANEGPISIHDDRPDGSFNVELSPSTTGQVRDVIVSWAMVTNSEFRTTAARIAADYAALLASLQPPPTVPGPTLPPGVTTVPPTTQPPPPPPPPPTVTFNAFQVESPESDGEVRIQIDQQLGTPQPESWSVSFHPDGEGAAVFSSAFIRTDARESFDAALRDALGGDATEWTHRPGTLTTTDLSFDPDGNLLVRLPAALTQSDGQTTVTLSRDAVKPMLSPMGEAVRDGKPAYRGRPDCSTDRCVALTYDDGPSPYTSQLLDYLDRARVPATFFMIGSSVEKYPDRAKEVADRGYQIGNHTWTHPRLSGLDLAGQRAEIEPTQRIIEQVTGLTPDMLRPPYGSYSDETRWQQLALMLWNVDTNDWSHRDPAKTVSTALSEVKPGSVILMHDLHQASVIATPYLIARLRGLGYSVVSLDTLFPVREPGAIFRGADDTEPPPPPTTAPPPPTTAPPGATTVPPPEGGTTPATGTSSEPSTPGVDVPATPPPADAGSGGE